MNPSYAAKLLRKAKKFERQVRDESVSPETRAKAATRKTVLETEMVGLLYNPHAYQNAEVELKRAQKKLASKSTNDSNRTARQEAVRQAERNVQATASAAANLEQYARDLVGQLLVQADSAPDAPAEETNAGSAD